MEKRERPIMELLHEFHQNEIKNGDDYVEMIGLFERIRKHPDYNLEVYRKALETDLKILVPNSFHFYWVFVHFPLKIQFAILKEVYAKEKKNFAAFDLVIIYSNNLFSCLNFDVRKLPRSFMFLWDVLKWVEDKISEFYKDKIILVSLLEAVATEESTIRKFFEELDDKYKECFERIEPR